MASSGIIWIDVTFDWCVKLLVDVAKSLGITYEEINVYLFVIALPLILIISILLNVWFFVKIKNLQKKALPSGASN